MKRSWLPEVGTWQYYFLLVVVTGVLFGPLGGLAAGDALFALALGLWGLLGLLVK